MSEMKKAILVVSFGTSVNETREKTIDKIEEDIAAAFPGYSVRRAWTSGMIIRKIQKRDGIKIDTVKEAMDRLVEEGFTEVIVQPTHILNGIENDFMIADVKSYSDKFERISFGTALLTTTEDNLAVIDAIRKEFPHVPDDEALVFMGHGTEHYTNTVYAAMDFTLKDHWHNNIFMGTVEAYPSVETMIKLVRELGPTKVHLAPFMIVAGDHAINDMAGDGPESWKNVFKNEGYNVVCHIKGIGEYPGIRSIFVEHARQAIEGHKEHKPMP